MKILLYLREYPMTDQSHWDTMRIVYEWELRLTKARLDFAFVDTRRSFVDYLAYSGGLELKKLKKGETSNSASGTNQSSLTLGDCGRGQAIERATGSVLAKWKSSGYAGLSLTEPNQENNQFKVVKVLAESEDPSNHMTEEYEILRALQGLNMPFQRFPRISDALLTADDKVSAIIFEDVGVAL